VGKCYGDASDHWSKNEHGTASDFSLDIFSYRNIIGDVARAGTASDAFNAIGEPTRRAILEYLAPGERSVGDIVDGLDVAQPSVSKHLRVLLDVGLVELRRDGRRAFYRANPDRIRTVHEWTSRFERHWRRQLGRVKQRAEQT